MLRPGLPVLGCCLLSLLHYAAIAAPCAGQETQSTEAQPAASAVGDTGIRAPEGFEVSLFAGDDLAHDIFSMTLDSQGRVVVAGQGYVKTLHDDDGDGVADRASLFSDRPKSGAHGMLFLGNDLLCTGDESLMLLRDTDDDGQADGEPEVWAKVRHPEHGANGLTRGPDGWIYLICGNDAGVTSLLATTDGSPVKQPQCGAVVRFSPDGKRSEIVAHGFRNPYDIDFNADGHFFTVDADGERDHHLPWYAPTRLFDIAQGMHHGWVLQGWQRSWNRPEWMFDNVERLSEIGRGSPTGLIVYRHHALPERYRGSVLSCCWTLGRVYCLPLEQQGSTYRTEAEVFLETTGEVGFAPVDIAVGKAGDLFVAIGGRRTRGSVFRIRYTGESQEAASPSKPIESVLNAPQPQAAWSRANWEPRAREIGERAFAEALLNAELQPLQRMRAAEILGDLFQGVDAAAATQLIDEAKKDKASASTVRIAARAVSMLGRSEPSEKQVATIAAATHAQQPLLQRAAWEALAAVEAEANDVSRSEAQSADWEAGLNSTDRRVRAAALLADARWREAPAEASSEADLWRLHLRGKLSSDHFSDAAGSFLEATDDRKRLDAVRLMELSLGDIDTHQMQADVYAGYSLNGDSKAIAAAAEAYGSKLAAGFPFADPNLNRELARLLGMLRVEDAGLLDRLSQVWTEGSSPHDDIHYLIVMSRLPGARNQAVTERTAGALARLHGKMRDGQMFVSRNWPLRVGEAVSNLYRNDPALAATLVAHPAFRSANQAMFTTAMESKDRLTAARKLMREAPDPSDEQTRWTDELVNLIAELPNDEALPALRTAWEDFSLRDSIVAVLARARQPEDRPLFVEMLGSVQPRSVELSATALTMLTEPPTEAELLAAMSALKQACTAPEQQGVRQSLAHLLSRWTGQSPTINEQATKNLPEAYKPWFDWFELAHADAAARLRGPAGADNEAWQQRVEKLDWSLGDVQRGSLVFQKRSCARCHAGSSPLGPDLAGAAGRFSRADLLTAIVDPNKDVSPLYQTTQIVTGSGRVYNGMIVYESPDSTLLQTAPDTTTRITGDEILVMRKSKISLMPGGLLNDISDQELADLFAYLKTLKPRR